MRRCRHCSRPKGISRPFWYSYEFCSRRCAQNFAKKAQELEKQRQHLAYLSRASPSP